MADRVERIEQLRQHALEKVIAALRALGLPEDVNLERPKNPEWGDVGFPCFPYARIARKNPAQIAVELAEHIPTDDIIEATNPTGPYLNLKLRAATVTRVVLGQALAEGAAFGAGGASDPRRWMVEFSAPNTNKPQHLGHVRNNLLGAAVSRMLAVAGHDVVRVNLINDRGIHICKSMLAYQRWGEGATPESTGTKGDHFVGRYYVRFDREQKGGAHGDLVEEAQAMLRRWEAGDEETVALWTRMNGWVYEGFDTTYARLGVSFDHVYHESETYLLGKEIVDRGLEAGIFTRRADGAILCDLTQIGLDGDKVLLRSDGTSVYMTQDLGTAMARFDEYGMDRMTYVVADEQEHHFRVLFGILALLRPSLEGACHHLSYGMVNLPEGKMKSREGTVVDADDLMDGMRDLAREEVLARDHTSALEPEEVDRRAEIIGLAALKYYLLNFTPRATVSFDPKKSIDFLGQTGPYCLYAYARIQSLFRKAGPQPGAADLTDAIAARLDSPLEQAVVRELERLPTTLTLAARTFDTAKITDQVYRIAKAFAALYTDRGHQIVGNPDTEAGAARLVLAAAVANAIQTGLTTLGIETLDAM